MEDNPTVYTPTPVLSDRQDVILKALAEYFIKHDRYPAQKWIRDNYLTDLKCVSLTPYLMPMVEKGVLVKVGKYNGAYAITELGAKILFKNHNINMDRQKQFNF
jgi:predicted transcriptional regulator